MADTVEQPSGGAHHQIPNLRLADEGGHEDIMAGIVQAARAQPAAVVSLLVRVLQQDEVSARQKVVVYEGLRTLLLEQGVEAGLIGSLIAVASQQMRAAPEEASSELQAAASDTLATLAGCSFGPVMRELQRHLRPFVRPAEFTLLTLGKVAAASVYRCVPFLGITLATMQTVMREIDDSRRRGAFCSALESMCGAIRTYLRCWERSTYPQVTRQRFSAYLFPMYQHLIGAWLPSEDTGVRLAVLQALGLMLDILLSGKDLQTQIYGDIPLLLAQYKENVEAFCITKLLGQILEASSSSNNPIPLVHMEAIACTLSCQVTSKAQRPHRLCRENRTEISHVVLQLAACSHPSELMGIFQTKLETGRGVTRVGILALMSDVIGAEVPCMASQKHLCVKCVKSVLTDENPRVRVAVLQAIGTLVSAGYLDKVEGWPLSYIALQLSVSTNTLERPVRSLPLGGLLEKLVQKTSLETLATIIASGRGISQELWARLLGYVTRTPYTDSMTPLCRCLRILAEKRQQHRQAAHGCSEPVASPMPQQLLARLLVLSASPFEGEGRGAAALLLLNALRPEMYGAEAEQWWMEIPAMVQYLAGHSEFSLDRAAWEHKLLEFLRKTLGRSQEASWSQELSRELSRQMGSYGSSSVEKAFLCKALGTALAMGEDPAVVRGQLRELLSRADYLSGAEMECLGSCLRLCASHQLDATLGALGDFEEEMAEGEDSWHLSLCKGLAPWERDRVKSALLLFYSRAAAQAPPQQLLPRLANEIVPKILHHYSTSSQVLGLNPGQKDTALTLRFLETVSAVSLAVQRGGESQPHLLPHKQTLLCRLLEIVKAEPRGSLLSPVRQQAMAAIGHLSKVKQPLSCEMNGELMEQCLDSVFSLPPREFTEDGGPIQPHLGLSPLSWFQTLYASTMATLEGLLQTLLEEDETPGRLQGIFRLLQKWLVSEQAWERARAMRVSTHLLSAYRRRVTVTTVIPPGQLSALAGTLGPYTCDSLGSIRQGAGDAIRCLLDIQVAKQPWSRRGQEEEWALRRVCQELHSGDPREAWDASLKLAHIVSGVLPKGEILPFTQTLLESVGAVSRACDKAGLLWLHTLLTGCASDLEDAVQPILSMTCACLRCMEDPELRGLLAQAVSLLARHHREAVLTYLLLRPLPLDQDSKALWAALAAEDLFQGVLKDLLDRIPKGPAAEQGAETQGAAAASPLPVICAIGEMALGARGRDALGSLLPELCCALLHQLSRTPDSAVHSPSRAGRAGAGLKGAAPPPATPRSLTVAALRSVLAKGLQGVARTLDKERGWGLLEDPRTFPEGVSLLARALVRADEAPLDEILQLLFPSLSSPCEGCRVTGTAFYAELMNHAALRQRRLLRPVLRRLVAGAGDESDAVRRLAARGLGNMAQGAPQKVKKHRRLLLDTLRCPLSEPSSPQVVSESMRALSKTLGQLSESAVGRLSQPLAVQARAYFLHEDGAVRTAAFGLFGALAGSAQRRHRQLFTREVRSSWAALMLHVRDPSSEAAQACYDAFHACAPFLGLTGLEGACDSRLLPPVSGERHRQLMGHICKRLAQKDPAMLDSLVAETCLHLHSRWAGVRLAAAALAGILVENMEAQHVQQLDLGNLLCSLRALHGDPSPAVKIAATEAVSTISQKQRAAPQEPGLSPTAPRGRGRLLFVRKLFRR